MTCFKNGDVMDGSFSKRSADAMTTASGVRSSCEASAANWRCFSYASLSGTMARPERIWPKTVAKTSAMTPRTPMAYVDFCMPLYMAVTSLPT